MFFDFYEYLKLDFNCSQTEINQRIRELQIIYHPDKRDVKDVIAESAIRILNEANEKIGTAKARKEYNKEYKAAKKEAKKSANRNRDSGSSANNSVESIIEGGWQVVKEIFGKSVKKNKKAIDKAKYDTAATLVEEGLKFFFGNKQADSGDNKCDTDDEN
jgi:curved DNA-binding protein CbpA